MTRQRDNARGRYFCAPPENAATFHELFLFIWEHGVGNTLAGAGGPGVKWSRESLAIALDEAASPRSIDDWRSGARVPSDTNVRVLLSVVSDASTREAWQRVLINAAAEGREKNRQNGNGEKVTAPDFPADAPKPAFSLDLLQRLRANRWLLGAAALASLVAVALFVSATLDAPVDHARLEVGDRFRDRFLSGEHRTPEMIVLPRGNFVMGSLATDPGREPDEDRRHSVNIDYRLAVGVREVTWDEYQLCVEEGACSAYTPDDEGWGRGDQPVVNLNFNDVYAYLHWLNDELGIAWERGDRYTLLTEAEWEYAALAGVQGVSFAPFATGDTLAPHLSNYSAGRPEDHGRPVAVASYPANAWGLHDMHGNVWEWVEDCYRDRHTALPNDGRAWLTPHCLPGARRVQKGGSFADPMTDLRASNRRAALPEERRRDVGFRLARRLDGPNWDAARPEG